LASKPPPAIEKVVLKALARDPAKRFQTCAEMRSAIEEAMAKTGLRATSEDVAQFIAANTKERIDERARVVKIALDAAAERERVKAVLDDAAVSSRPKLDSSSGDIPIASVAQPTSIPTPSTEAPVSTVVRASSPAAQEVEPVAEETRGLPSKRTMGTYAIVGAMAIAAMIGLGALLSRRGTDAAAASPPSTAPTQTQTAAPPIAIPPPAIDAGAATTPTTATATSATPSATAKPLPTSTGKGVTRPAGSNKRPPRKHDDDQIQ